MKLLQDIKSGNGLKAWVSSKKADSKAIKFIKENAIKKTFGKRFSILLNFDFFKYPVYHYRLKEDLIIRLEHNFCCQTFL